MFEILLSSKLLMEVSVLNTKILVSNSKPKLIKFDKKSKFSFKYNFAEKNSVVFCVDFYFLNDNLVTDNQNIKIVKQEENKFLVQILQKNAVFLQKKVKKLQNNNIFYNFYQNGLVEIETNDEILFSQIFDFEILDADILSLNNDFVAIKLFGASEEACLVLNNQFLEVDFFENSIVEKTEQGYKVLTDLKDIACHGLVREYAINQQAVLVDEYSVYLKGRPIMFANANIVPLYFAQCIKAKDFSMAKSLLCDNLKGTAKQEHLANFFGKFYDVYVDMFDCNTSVLCFEYQKNRQKYIKKFIFILKNGLIENIR